MAEKQVNWFLYSILIKFFTNYKYSFSLQDDNQQNAQMHDVIDKWKQGFLSNQQLLQILLMKNLRQCDVNFFLILHYYQHFLWLSSYVVFFLWKLYIFCVPLHHILILSFTIMFFFLVIHDFFVSDHRQIYILSFVINFFLWLIITKSCFITNWQDFPFYR